MQFLVNMLHGTSNLLWGVPMIVVLMGTHFYTTFRTKFIQRKVFTGIRLSVVKDASSTDGDISQFGALTTALASTVGTGNIIGVGTAVALGGPGAVFWIWITGVFGMATKYAESLIAIKYRVRTQDGRMLGGAMYALDRGMKQKWLGKLFAVFTAFAAFGIGSSVQSNAVATTLYNNFSVPTWVTAVVISIFLVLVIFGGVKSISRVSEALIPVMAIGYVLCSIIILILQYETILPALNLIITSAFSPRPFAGGMVGAGVMIALRYGVARGLFSNESGMGSAPIAAASAQTKNPCRQALVSMTGTFWDTVVICLMTGLVIVSGMIASPELFPVKDGLFMVDGAQLTSYAFSTIPVFGPIFLAISLTLFAFTTILGWSHYGERAAEYLFGEKIITPYRVVYITVALLGCLIALDLVWGLADILNALMVIPNVIAIVALMDVITKDTNYYIYEDRLSEVDVTPIPTRNKDGSLPESAYDDYFFRKSMKETPDEFL